LDSCLQHAEDDSAGVDLLLCELIAGRQRLVPAAEHEQRIGPLGQSPPLIRPAAELAGKRERLIQISEGVCVAVAAEAAVGEEEVTGARVRGEVVLESDLERVLHERERFLPVAAAERDGTRVAENERKRFGG